MSAWSEHVVPAFALGAALGAAPGPVQLLILNETAAHGIVRGLRVMLGANGTLFVVLATLAVGFSTVEPSPAVVRALRIVGGSFLLWLAVDELRTIRRAANEERHGEEPQGLRTVVAAGRRSGRGIGHWSSRGCACGSAQPSWAAPRPGPGRATAPAGLCEDGSGTMIPHPAHR